ncbi:PocR ligand-binding domain-containing protein [Zhaonella formicivorans]|uniref:PocR ligand-binding domain-containing protein n=1 Tax=Zhaonella formicivorans TaxID=2528593 RepID=UPI0010E684B1|nr:PocR ligand-binding domain-containing protein [Zhaonella formicivorans]
MEQFRVPTEEEIRGIVETYKIATGTNCAAFNLEGEIITGGDYGKRSSFCRLVQQYDQKKSCKKSYIYGGLQSEKLGDAYIYFCPYGLVNWTVPVMGNNEVVFFLVGGPVLLHKVDSLLVEEIIRQLPQLGTNFHHVGTTLNELQVFDPVRVNHLAGLLMLAAKSLRATDVFLEGKRNRANINANVARVIQNLKKEIFTHKIGEGAGKPYPFEREKELIAKVRLGDRQGAKEILNDIIGYMFFYNRFELVKLVAVSLMVVLARAALEVGVDLEILFGAEYLQLRRIFDSTDINELSVELTKAIDWFIDCTFPVVNIKNRNVIFKAMSYIRENYSQICLEAVAGEVGLSAAYFSKLFKEETGRSYSEYLNRVRIEASKELLKKGLPLVEIAQMVGFNDQSYFTNIFKKYEGVSPRKWKQNGD